MIRTQTTSDEDQLAIRKEFWERVGVPTGFYTIFLHERPSGFIDAIALLLPQTDDEVPKSWSVDQKLSYLEDHSVSIDDTEAVTNFDFLSELSEEREQAVEKSVASGPWQ